MKAPTPERLAEAWRRYLEAESGPGGPLMPDNEFSFIEEDSMAYGVIGDSIEVRVGLVFEEVKNGRRWTLAAQTVDVPLRQFKVQGE